MSFAVATTKTGALVSCIHDRIAPSTRIDVPPSRPPAASAFSIPSTHSTHGAMVSGWTGRRFGCFIPLDLPLSGLATGIL